MSDRFIAARLRKGLDDDLFEATKQFNAQKKSDLIRTGLRLALGITSQKVMEVREKPVSVPKLFLKK